MIKWYWLSRVNKIITIFTFNWLQVYSNILLIFISLIIYYRYNEEKNYRALTRDSASAVVNIKYQLSKDFVFKTKSKRLPSS
jgi:ABC-type nickel/cobalt efflux system permease component RcnA